MKLVTFSVATPIGRAQRLGALLDRDETGRIVDLTSAYAAYLAMERGEPRAMAEAALRTPPDMIAWLEGGKASRKAAEDALGYARTRSKREKRPLGLNEARLVFDRAEIRLMAPLPRPRSLRDFSIYEDHMTKAERPFIKTAAWYKFPPYYKGNPDAVMGPEDPIPYPYYTKRLDLEIEIGIVIGREGRDLTFAEARRHIAGYTIFIDASCRDYYEREPFGPTKRKDFCNVFGPSLVTADEIDEADLDCSIAVDGETWFEGNTGKKRNFLAEHLVAYISDNETIHPGDIIGTGTIGLGCSMDIRKWPKVGQTATFWVEGLGTLSHKIVRGKHRVSHSLGMKGLLAPKGEGK